MALPLILGAGAGILGGVQYLMNRADNRAAQETQARAQSFIQNAPNLQGRPDLQDNLFNRLEQANDDAGFFDTGRNDRNASLLDMAGQWDMQAGQQAQQAAAAQEALQYGRNQDLIANSRQEANELDKDYKAGLGQYQQLSQGYRGAIDALQNGTKADALFALYSVMGVVDPGGRITDSEQDNFDNLTGFLGLPAQFFRDVQGKGLGPNERQDLLDALQRRFTPLRETAIRQRDYYKDRRDRLLQRGYEAQDPIGSLGIDWELGASQVPRVVGRGGQGAPKDDSDLPPGFSRTPPPKRTTLGGQMRRNQRNQ